MYQATGFLKFGSNYPFPTLQSRIPFVSFYDIRVSAEWEVTLSGAGKKSQQELQDYIQRRHTLNLQRCLVHTCWNNTGTICLKIIDKNMKIPFQGQETYMFWLDVILGVRLDRPCIVDLHFLFVCGNGGRHVGSATFIYLQDAAISVVEMLKVSSWTPVSTRMWWLQICKVLLVRMLSRHEGCCEV
jgi:hypothetical protein